MREIEPAVVAHTGLEPDAPAPPAELVGRRDWAEANLSSLAALLDPVAGGSRPLRRRGPARRRAAARAPARRWRPRSGLVTGYLSQRVLGQYELSLLGRDSAPRLLFVAPNLDRAATRLEVDRESFLRWVAIHELTHAFQFQGVPWLREHLGGLLREYLETVEVRIERGAAGRPAVAAGPAELVERFREGGLAALVQTRRAARMLDRVQAVMAVVEGYAEHVMDALAPDWCPSTRACARPWTRRRAQPLGARAHAHAPAGHGHEDAPVRARQGASATRSPQEGGIEGLNRVWERARSRCPTAGRARRPPRRPGLSGRQPAS